LNGKIAAAIVAALVVAAGLYEIPRLLSQPTTHLLSPTPPGHHHKHPEVSSKGQGTSSGSPSKGSSQSEGSGSSTATPVPEQGGLEGPVSTFFAALKAGDDQEAYLQMTPTWRQNHTFSQFESMLPSSLPTLESLQIVSAGNFTAQVQVTTASGGVSSSVQVVLNQTGSPDATSPVWRMGNWPLPKTSG